MGCGPHLHLMPAGVLKCLNRSCPRPMAAHELLSESESEHTVMFDDEEFTVRHPLRERLDAADELFSCPVHAMCSNLPGPPGGMTGRYRATLINGALDLQILEAGSVN